MWNYDEFAHFLIHFKKIFHNLVWKREGSGSFRPNNYISRRIRNTAVNISQVNLSGQAKMAEERITLIVRDAMVDCRRDQLWTRLMRGSPPLSYSEFVHLTTLVQHETLDEVRDIVTFLVRGHIHAFWRYAEGTGLWFSVVSEIRILDPEKIYPGSCIQGSKRNQIPDPWSGSATLIILI